MVENLERLTIYNVSMQIQSVFNLICPTNLLLVKFNSFIPTKFYAENYVLQRRPLFTYTRNDLLTNLWGQR